MANSCPDGNIETQMKYIDGRQEGCFKTFSNDGTMKNEMLYKQDRAVASTIYKDGEPLEKVCSR